MRRRTGCIGQNFSESENARIYGKCSNPYGHGHNYSLEVTLTGAVDPATGMVASLGELDPFVEREVVEAFDHKYLNEEVAEFSEIVPTAENICCEIYRRLKRFPAARLERVRLEETSKNSFELDEAAGERAIALRHKDNDHG